MAGDTRRATPDEDGDELDQGTFVDINVTPLVDIFLVLLVILMATSTAILETGQGAGRGFEVQLPQGSETDDVTEDSRAIVVAIGSDGAIVLDGDVLEVEELGEKLKAKLGPGAPSLVLVQADEDAKHKRVVEVMELARSLGVQNLAIATRR